MFSGCRRVSSGVLARPRVWTGSRPMHTRHRLAVFQFASAPVFLPRPYFLRWSLSGHGPLAAGHSLGGSPSAVRPHRLSLRLGLFLSAPPRPGNHRLLLVLLHRLRGLGVGASVVLAVGLLVFTGYLAAGLCRGAARAEQPRPNAEGPFCRANVDRQRSGLGAVAWIAGLAFLFCRITWFFHEPRLSSWSGNSRALRSTIGAIIGHLACSGTTTVCLARHSTIRRSARGWIPRWLGKVESSLILAMGRQKNVPSRAALGRKMCWMQLGQSTGTFRVCASIVRTTKCHPNI